MRCFSVTVSGPQVGLSHTSNASMLHESSPKACGRSLMLLVPVPLPLSLFAPLTPEARGSS